MILNRLINSVCVECKNCKKEEIKGTSGEAIAVICDKKMANFLSEEGCYLYERRNEK